MIADLARLERNEHLSRGSDGKIKLVLDGLFDKPSCIDDYITQLQSLPVVYRKM